MKNSFFFLFLFIAAIQMQAQTLEAEKQYMNMLINNEQNNPEKAAELGGKWKTFISDYKYPELPVNSYTGEVDFTDVILFENMDKQIIYQRCLQWIALNFQELAYHDLDAGKIIANGSVTLKHKAETRVSFTKKVSNLTETTANYTLVLTLKGNKLKYNITNVEYTFSNFSESIDEISMPMYSLFPVIAKDPLQWERYTTVLTETKAALAEGLKNAIAGYVKSVESDYKF